jgi:signal peptidase II
MPRLLLFLSLPLYILDQITKFWIVSQFPLAGEGRVIIDDFFTIHHIANTGIAFGNFNGGAYSNYIFGVVAILALGGITWAYRKGLFSGPYSRLAIALLAAGVCGNLTDRIVDKRFFVGPDHAPFQLLQGYVVDFLSFDLHVPFAHPWPSFNVADSCVVVAAFLLAIASFKEAPAKEEKAG